MKLENSELDRILKAGLLHDIGALSIHDRIELQTSETNYAYTHSSYSAELLEDFPPLKDSINIIRNHHTPWNYGEGDSYNGQKVDKLSHLLHLADRIVVLINTEYSVLDQLSRISQEILSFRGSKFIPEMVDAFITLSLNENILLNITSKNLLDIIKSDLKFRTPNMSINEVIEFAAIAARIIDSQSEYTKNHSTNVAKTAQKLAELMGFSKSECKLMLISGYLHDLGKLTVGKDILDKYSALNEEEISIIRSHPFYTQKLLSGIRNFDQINSWASLHHEKLDGSGYPYHLIAEDIPLGSRILSISDIFTALNERRPYRDAMSKPEIVKLMRSMVAEGLICSKTFSTLLYNYDTVKNATDDFFDYSNSITFSDTLFNPN